MLHPRPLAAAILFTAAGLAVAPRAQAVLYTDFAEYGTTVSGFQDDFDGTTLNPDWTLYGGDTGSFTLAGDGTLHLTTTAGGPSDDPNKLLYNPASPYSSSNQDVLMLIKVNADDTADGFRVGTATASDLTDGQGIDLLFRNAGPNGNDQHFNLLNDALAWGPAVSASPDPLFTLGNYYWLREDISTSGSTGTVEAKVWQAGTGEPAAYQQSWNYNGSDPNSLRAGLAGITGDSLGANLDASVDYILIQSSGLPSIQVVPEPAAAVSVLCGLGLLAARRRRTPVGPV